MKLDYRYPWFILMVDRREADVSEIMANHGLDLSVPASTAQTACLITKTPYAAVPWINYATPAALTELEPMAAEIMASRATDAPPRHWDCPAGLDLWPYQRANLHYALQRRHTLIADEPGLGKTMQAIVYANEIGAERILIMCPANIRLQWLKKIREWSTMRWPYTSYAVLSARQGIHPKANWTITSYDLARTEGIGKALAKGNYDLLIMDEAHYLKTRDAHRSRAIFGGGKSLTHDPIFSRCERSIALTGTPLPNRPAEAFVLAHNMCPDAIDWMSEDSFCERFNPRQKRQVTKKDGSVAMITDERTGRHAELQARLRHGFMCRHLKREVLTDLHYPKYDLISMEETRAIKLALQAERLLDIDPENLEGADASILGQVSAVRKMMGVAMAPSVASYVEGLFEGGEEKLVLFYWHIEVGNILEQHLRKYGVVRVEGSTSPVRRQVAVDRFMNEPGIRLMMGNLLSLGTGTDGLQRVCNHAIISEPDWTPGNNIQAFDRLDRGGQTRTVLGDICVAPGSLAERILAAALRKLQTTHKALDLIL